MNRKSC